MITRVYSMDYITLSIRLRFDQWGKGVMDITRRKLVQFSGAILSGTVFAEGFSNIFSKSVTNTISSNTAFSALTNSINAANTTTTSSVSLTPVLPQYDTATGKTIRQTALSASRATYAWSENVPNAVGIPMLANVPQQEQPDLVWGLEFNSILINLLLNFLTSIPATVASVLKPELLAIQSRLKSAQATYDHIVATVTPTDKTLPAQLSALKDLVSQVGIDFAVMLMTIMPQLGAIASLKDSDHSEDTYKSLFSTIPLPEIANTFHQDAVFAHLHLNGANPMLIKGVNSLPSKFPLTNAQYKQVMGANDSLAEAGASGRLYLLDYVDLGGLATSGPLTKPGIGTGYSYAPIALFAVPKAGGAMVPVAIQCDQDSSKNPIFLPAQEGSAGYWSWQMAKSTVQVAEENYHEMFVHLARTHLVTEAFCIATHRHLAPTHPLHVLLTPHFAGTLFINNKAASGLLPPGGFVDVMFAAPIETTQQVVGKNRLAFDFYASMLPVDLQNRNMMNRNVLPDFAYRDDGLLIWNAIANWVRDYINVYYTSDSDVDNDTELTAWVDDVANNGKISGFKAITSRQQLVDVITMIIFTATAQHAVVNFPQPELFGYAPAISAAAYAPAPQTATGLTEADWQKMMPPMLAAYEKINIYQILGAVHHIKLGQYNRAVYPYEPLMTDPRIVSAGGPLQRFQKELASIEQEIIQRNQSRAYPYRYLLPSQIPNSTNI